MCQLPPPEGGGLHLTRCRVDAIGRLTAAHLGSYGEHFTGQPFICPNPQTLDWKGANRFLRPTRRSA